MIAHIQTLRAAGFAPHRQTVRATAYQFPKEMVISNNSSDETETAGYDCWEVCL
jgi:hypothetical protein